MKKFLALLLAAIICFSLVACNKTPDENKDPDTSKAPVIQTTGDVKITKDNFEKYFEFVDETFFTKDGSGEYTQLRSRQYYKLKDEFNIDLTKSSIEFKYNYTVTTKKVKIDYDNQKYTFGEDIGEKKEIKGVLISKISQITYKDYAILLLQPTHASKGDTEMMYFSDFEVADVNGTIHLVEEASHSPEPHSH